MNAPRTDKAMRQAIAVATGNDETDTFTDQMFRAHRATLYGCYPGRQKTASAGWLAIKRTAQDKCLRALQSAHRAGRI